MNKQIATEILCKPGVRMTNKERKTLLRARDKDVTPAKFEALGMEHRLEYRLGQRNWGQLCRWHRRASARRKDTQAKFQILTRRQAKLGAKTGQPNDSEIGELLALQQGLHMLNGKAVVLDLFLGAVEDEIRRRQKLWQSVGKAGAPEFAAKLEGVLTK